MLGVFNLFSVDFMVFNFLILLTSLEKYIAPIPEVQRGDFMGAYYRYLTGNDEKKKMECAKAWSFWEMFTSKLYVSPENIARAEEDDVFYSSALAIFSW